MLTLVALALSVGLADSLNPSTVAPALYLAAGDRARRRLAEFTVGVFAVNLAGGLLLALGPGQLLLAAVHRPGHRTTHLLELGLGGLALALAAALWHERERVGRFAASRARPARSSFSLGAAIISVELPTAFPYFAVIATVVGSGQAIGAQAIVLVLFNLAFIAPLVAILAIRAFAGERAQQTLSSARAQIDRSAPILVPAAVAILALVLLLIGAVGVASD
jgi:cytochrome c biogenesis protein CcdA